MSVFRLDGVSILLDLRPKSSEFFGFEIYSQRSRSFGGFLEVFPSCCTLADDGAARFEALIKIFWWIRLARCHRPNQIDSFVPLLPFLGFSPFSFAEYSDKKVKWALDKNGWKKILFVKNFLNEKFRFHGVSVLHHWKIGPKCYSSIFF